MRLPDETLPWHIDVRPFHNSEKISLDLCRLLPRRALVGPVAVVCDRPVILLSVIKKRWSKIIREVEKQCSSTLEPLKKEGLKRELSHVTNCRFTSDPLKPADIRFTSTEQILAHAYDTICLASRVATDDLARLLTSLHPLGLLVAYHDWDETYENALYN